MGGMDLVRPLGLFGVRSAVVAPRRATRPARAGARWGSIWNDFPAAHASGLPLWRWLPWMLGCDAKSAVAWDDPMPLVRSMPHGGFARANHSPAVPSLKLHEQAG